MINLLFIFSKCKLQLGIWTWIMEMYIQFNIKSPSLSLLISLIWFSSSYRYEFVWNALKITHIKAPRNLSSIFCSPKGAKYVEQKHMRWIHQATVIWWLVVKYLGIGSQEFHTDTYIVSICILFLPKER